MEAARAAAPVAGPVLMASAAQLRAPARPQGACAYGYAQPTAFVQQASRVIAPQQGATQLTVARGPPVQIRQAQPSTSVPLASPASCVTRATAYAVPQGVHQTTPVSQAAAPAAAPSAAAAKAPAAAPALPTSLGYPLSATRMPKPHDLFPFDLFAGTACEGYLSEELQVELDCVRNHCMQPPYPWGQVVYHDFLVDNVLREVPGDMAELGIGQGGTSLFFARLAKRYGRKFLAVDSFEGLPPPDLEKDNHYFLQGDYRAKDGKDNFQRFLDYKSEFDVDDNLTVLKGFFKDVEIPADFQSFAFVHMDSDLYSSVYDSLEKVWDLVSPGGAIAIDDFFHHAQGPARAVADFFRARGEEPPLMYVVPTYAVLIVKGRSACLKWHTMDDGSKVPIMHGPRALDGNFYSLALARGCQPFVSAAAASAGRAAEAVRERERSGLDADKERRVSENAEAFVRCLRYPKEGARSGCDVLRYLLPLEDLFDISEGRINGVKGTERRTIEIGI